VRVLAGDIGGTKTAIAVVDVGPTSLTVRRLERYGSADYAGLEEILEDFLRSERSVPEAAGFGVAGPVREGSARITNLPWRIETRRLARSTGIRWVALENDFVSSAMGLRYLRPEQLATLSRGRAEPGAPIAIVGAGTGLGQAAVVTARGAAVVVPSEGGHADFGPTSPVQDRLATYLRGKFGRASRERVLSGPGLVRIYEFLKADGAPRETRDVVEAFEKSDDRAAVISRFGLSGRDPLCRAALDLFVSIYGSEAGNAALQYRATGGVYIGGGIAPKILPALRRPGFRIAFRSKPPMQDLLIRIPVRVVLDPRLGLFGAAAAAYRTRIETTRPSSTTSVRRART
jgi:glucokinase